jgi:hypothetical protein
MPTLDFCLSIPVGHGRGQRPRQLIASFAIKWANTVPILFGGSRFLMGSAYSFPISLTTRGAVRD